MLFRMRYVFIFGILTTLLATSSAQTTPPESIAPLQFMLGNWQVTSERNEEAYLTQAAAPDAEWQTTTGDARIEAPMHDSSIIEHYISHMNEQRYAQTFFLGTRNDGQSWDTALTDNVLNKLYELTGDYEDERLTLIQSGHASSVRWQAEIEETENGFVWRLFLLIPDSEPEVIWVKQYTPIDETTYEEQIARLHEMYPDASVPPKQMSDFHFWLGTWQVDTGREVDVVDFVTLGSGGHAMLEFWQQQDSDTPMQFFTMTIWDADMESYYNWFWGRGQTTTYTGGRCEGEGAEKECRLAGRFYNITDESITWTFGNMTWIFNRLKHP